MDRYAIARMMQGLERIGRKRTTIRGKKTYHWAVSQAYLGAWMSNNGLLKHVFARELTVCVMEGCNNDFIAGLVNKERAKKYIENANKKNSLVLTKVLILDRVHDGIVGGISKYWYERRIEKALSKLLEKNTVASLSLAGHILLYWKISLKRVGKDALYMRLYSWRDRIVRAMEEKENPNHIILYKLTGNKKYLKDLAEMEKPTCWIVWKKNG